MSAVGGEKTIEKKITEIHMFKTETHLHTREASPCGRLTAREMVEMYAAAGYSTIVITDHFEAATMEPLGDMPWEEKVDCFYRGYREAKALGDEIGVVVIPAAEVELTYYDNHYLVYGDVIDFLKANERIYELPPEEFYRRAKEADVLVFQAHPYRDEKCYPTPDYVDGVEVFNSNSRHEDFSPKTLALANERGLLMISGSDAHREEDIAGGGILTEKRIETADDLSAVIRGGEYSLIRDGRKVYVSSDVHGELNSTAITDYLGMASDNDLLIILGDVCFDFDEGGESDVGFTDWFKSLGKKVAFIDGNHENHPALRSYPTEEWCGGIVHRISENVVYMPRGEIYDIGGKRIFVFGGCKSSEKWHDAGLAYPEENPTSEEVDRAIAKLREVGNKVDFILTHKYEARIDKNVTEELLRLTEYIEENVEYRRWCYGHWHSESDRDAKHRLIYKTVRELK